MENSNNSHQDVSTLYAHPQETKRMCWQRVGHDVDKPSGLVKGQEMRQWRSRTAALCIGSLPTLDFK
jgi:hypothetical protein